MRSVRDCQRQMAFMWSSFAPHMSDFGGKADMTLCGESAFAVAIGVIADIAFCGANVCF